MQASVVFNQVVDWAFLAPIVSLVVRLSAWPAIRCATSRLLPSVVVNSGVSGFSRSFETLRYSSS